MDELIVLALMFTLLLLVLQVFSRLQERGQRSRRHAEAETERPPPDRIEQLLHELARSDQRSADRVAARLAMMGPGILERLFAALGHADFWEGIPAGERPRQMLEDLIAAFGASAVPRSIELLTRSPAERMKLSAGRILVEVGAGALEPLLRNGDRACLATALKVLEAGDRSEVEELLRLLGEDERRNTDIAAILVRLGPDALPALRRYTSRRPPAILAADMAQIADHLEREAPREEPDAAAADPA